MASCAIGVPMVILGRTADIPWLTGLGGWMTVPFTLLAGSACFVVVLFAPMFPLGWLIRNARDKTQGLVIALCAAIQILWIVMCCAIVYSMCSTGT